MVVEIRDVYAGYGKQEVLKGVNLSVESGNIVVLMGPNGSGKTTLTNVMLGYLRPWKGTVKLFGEKIAKDIFRYIGVVFEEPAIYEELSALDNVKMFSDVYGGNPREALSLVGLPEHVWKKPIFTFSRGMKRKVELARAIVHRPKLLVLDEATSGLDPASRSEIHKILKNMKADGTTIFFTSHYLEEAGRLADKVYFLKDGTIITGEQLNVSFSHMYFRLLTKEGVVERKEATAEQFQSILEGLKKGVIISVTLEGASLEDVFEVLRGE